MLNQKNILRKIEIYLFIVYLLPVTLLLWFIANFSVNVPFWDQWQLVPFFEKVASGNANLADWFSQHNEHRLVFPRIIFVTLSFASKWDTRLEMYFSVFLAIVSFCAMYKMAEKNQNKNPKLFHLFNIAICILTFSLIQYENWLWGFQLAWFLINTCTILAIFFLIATEQLLPNQRLSLSAVCCFIASFSSAHGLLSWIATLPTVAVVDGSPKQKKLRIGIWITLFTLSFVIYQIGYQKPEHHPDLFFSLKQPLVAIEYLLTILGMAIGKVFIPTAVSGLIILLLFFFFNIFYFRSYHSEFARDATPWLSLGWFATLFALMTTLGRAGFGAEHAVQSRYTSVSILLAISLLQMGQLLIYKQWEKWNTKNSYIFFGYILFACVLTIMFISNSGNAMAQAKETWLQRTRGKACLELFRFFEPSIAKQSGNCLQSIYFNPSQMTEVAEPLQRIGFRDFSKNIAFTNPTNNSYGSIETTATINQPLVIPKNGSISLSGWTRLPEGREQPKVVLLSYGSNQSFFANAVVKLDRPDMGKSFNSNAYNKSGWEANVSPSSIPIGETVIKAWIVDPESQRFVKLDGEQKVKVVE